MDILTIMKTAVGCGASDIHICVGRPPVMRLRGELAAVPGCQTPLSAENTRELVYSVLSDDQRARFERDMELDASFGINSVSRFRINVLVARGGVEAVMRIIPSVIPEPAALGLGPNIMNFADLPRGLVLVTGPTGSGKTTTLAAVINRINTTQRKNILTIEDPIEFTYVSRGCIIRQREVGLHTRSFSNALRSTMREDPDVILVGEMRDLETVQLTVTAAETGHLTFGTLHTQDAPSSVDRIIDVFPSHQQDQVRVQLASCLRGVVSQVLLPRKDGRGRVAAREVMIMTPAIANIIREGKTHMIYSAIETGAKFGMQSLDRALALLVQENLVDYQTAFSKARSKEDFTRYCGGVI